MTRSDKTVCASLFLQSLYFSKFVAKLLAEPFLGLETGIGGPMDFKVQLVADDSTKRKKKETVPFLSKR